MQGGQVLTDFLLTFLLVLARVGGALVFVPLPGIRQGPATARAVLAACVAFALYPVWPAAPGLPDVAVLTRWLVGEVALGMAAGVAVAFLNEAFTLAAQIFGLPAGYAYAATIDPTTEADSGVLLVVAQLVAGLLFVACDLHLEVVRVFAQSLVAYPPGTFQATPAHAQALISVGAATFSQGMRLALPVVALLMLVDVALSLLGRLNAQLQLLTLAFPVKMLGALLMLAMSLAAYTRVYRAAAGQCLATLARILAHGG